MNSIEQITASQLWAGVMKLAIAMVTFVAIVSVGLLIVGDRAQGIAMNALFFSVGFGFLANGFLALLKIIDWFEARKAKSNG